MELRAIKELGVLWFLFSLAVPLHEAVPLPLFDGYEHILLGFKCIQSLACHWLPGRGRLCVLASLRHLILEVELRLYSSGTLLPEVTLSKLHYSTVKT